MTARTEAPSHAAAALAVRAGEMHDRDMSALDLDAAEMHLHWIVPTGFAQP